MQTRGEIFFNFFAKYPEAECHDFQHKNGKSSTIAIGLFQGLVDEGFVGVYDADGRSLAEARLGEEALAKSVGKNRVGYADAFEFLKSHAVGRATRG
ncbi:hypothetical protein AEQ67_09315 [Pseudomonas sp. RIT-PI-q]|uniref:hypothetical protein n=1 Tax=Pseudomonas sp. RIT-PI-q TaxID=1690247 RepID=UPI0006CDF3F5|nr:hypothetical protein [Pseudomonas sp. RIT-PI-q]KPH00193.1 hypothetical protein AEQ67_09315 [Pseudomonas sp. RIT-PI-q]